MSEERGEGEGVGSQVLSNTLRYINLAEVALGLVELRGPMYLCPCVSAERGRRSSEETDFFFFFPYFSLLFLVELNHSNKK